MQVFVTGEPLKALMLWCRGTYFWHSYYCADLLLVNLLKHCCYGAEVPYFDFSSGMENRTWFQICDRLYLPMFLLRVGLLTLM